MQLCLAPGQILVLHYLKDLATVPSCPMLFRRACPIFFLLATLGAARNSKRGVAWASNVPSDILILKNRSGISWEYGWNVPRPENLDPKIEHVPMLWGSRDAAAFQSQVISQKSDVVLVSCPFGYWNGH